MFWVNDFDGHIYGRRSGTPRRRESSRNKPTNAIDLQLQESISKLQTVAEHLVEGNLVADTEDREDHTFSGKFNKNKYIFAR
jgi:hypothetical protein